MAEARIQRSEERIPSPEDHLNDAASRPARWQLEMRYSSLVDYLNEFFADKTLCINEDAPDDRALDASKFIRWLSEDAKKCCDPILDDVKEDADTLDDALAKARGASEDSRHILHTLAFVVEAAGQDCSDVTTMDHWLVVIDALASKAGRVLDGKMDTASTVVAESKKEIHTSPSTAGDPSEIAIGFRTIASLAARCIDSGEGTVNLDLLWSIVTISEHCERALEPRGAA